MNAPQLLKTLQARGVYLVPDSNAPSGVKAIAPPGVVTTRVAECIRRALPALLPLITPQISQEELLWEAQLDRLNKGILPRELLALALKGASIPPRKEWENWSPDGRDSFLARYGLTPSGGLITNSSSTNCLSIPKEASKPTKPREATSHEH